MILNLKELDEQIMLIAESNYRRSSPEKAVDKAIDRVRADVTSLLNLTLASSRDAYITKHTQACTPGLVIRALRLLQQYDGSDHMDADTVEELIEAINTGEIELVFK